MTPAAEYINYIICVTWDTSIYHRIIIIISYSNGGSGVGADGVLGDVPESVKNQLYIIINIIMILNGRTDYARFAHQEIRTKTDRSFTSD